MSIENPKSIQRLDASKPIDCDEIERQWNRTMEERERASARDRGEFAAAPVFVASAEGTMIFPGFGEDQYGKTLKSVARAALNH
jgi:hypothetical protein